ncbi:ATP-binding protein [Bacillus toyonensis]|uniref:ATP-binding protein n=1 Tax=Bacillus toyonensis TaxID=155322 RepID=UPI000BF103C8|nr:ATP-binding protein [Bacillus toyonensis]PEJ12097.1 OLD family endonuclease [Bacillus toyonensis]
MKLRSLCLKNFRGYTEALIDFDENMNVIIGKNDIGKSTIMEALEIFFNGDNRDTLVKAEINDCNIYCSDKKMEIGAKFSFEEHEITIVDTSNPTSLKEEFLLNEDGLLEIRKVWDCSKNSLTSNSLTVYLVANYPDTILYHLITLKQRDLRKLLENNTLLIEDYESINKTKNAEMRKALHNFYITQDTQFKEELIEIKKIDSDSKNIWDKIKTHLPLFFLFQSDRANSDSDSEVQNPLKIATKKVLGEIEDKLDQIVEDVKKEISSVAEHTIEKLKDFDGDIATNLKTNLKLKTWDSLFSFQLESDNGISLNKRGSGIKRLILISYFRAEAERISKEQNNRDIIYAIEEPETSQHPNYQKMILESLLKISQDSKHQVIITTHTPEIAKMVSIENLIFINKINNTPIIIENEEDKLKGIVETLGILPTIESKVVLCVEGPNDVNFLRNINESIDEYKNIIDLKALNISIIPMRGSNLVTWVNENYLNNSNVIELHIYDNDMTKYKEKVSQMMENQDGRRFGFITAKREMENYIPAELIEKEFSINLDKHKIKWDTVDVPKLLIDLVMQNIKDPKEREDIIKQILNGQLTKKITKSQLEYCNSYEEIKIWFEHIAEFYQTNWYKKMIASNQMPTLKL